MTDKPYEPTLNDIYAKDTIYIRPPYKQVYRINIYHPEVREYYERFKAEMKIPPWCPLADSERLGFERLVLCGYYPIKLKRV